jgi:DNA-binding CsgD family transcriptional regulator
VAWGIGVLLGTLMATTNPVAVPRRTALTRSAIQSVVDRLPASLPLKPPRPTAQFQFRSPARKLPAASVDRALSAALSLFQQCGIGFVVCEDQCNVLSANEIAQQILFRRDGLEINSDGVLSTTEEGGESLTDVVAQAANTSVLKVRSHFRQAIAVLRPQRKRALTLIVQSVTQTVPFRDSVKLAVLLIIDATLSHDVNAEDFRRLFGFTAVESLLANLLIEGKSLEESCGRLGIRRSTGCSHLRRMFKKTGVHQQSHLVALLLKSIGLLRCTSDTTSSGPRVV